MLTDEEFAELENFLSYSKNRTPYHQVLGGQGRPGMLRRYHEATTGQPIPPGQEGSVMQGPPTPAGLGMTPLNPLQQMQQLPQATQQAPQQAPQQFTGGFTPSQNDIPDLLTDNLHGGPQVDESGQVIEGEGEYRGAVGMGNYDPSKAIQSEHYYESVGNSRLEGQLDRQRNTAERLTGEEAPDTDDTGMLTKILDNLMRPNYAMAGGFRALQEKSDEDMEHDATVNAEDLSMFQKITQLVPELQIMRDMPEFLGGMKDGFTLEKKETFSDVLENAGVENKVAKGIGGFILDVALDPTTYVGGGVVKAATKSSMEAASLKAAAEAYSSPQALKAAEQTVNNKIQHELLERAGPNAKKGAAKFEPPTEAAKKSMIDKELRDHAESIGKFTLETAKLANKGAVEFKLAGKTVAKSEALYKGFSTLSKPVREMPTVRFFYSKMSPQAELGDMWQIMRDREGMSTGSYFDFMRPFREATQGLNDEMAKAVTHGLEGTIQVTDPEVLKVMDTVKKMFDELWDAEVAIGLHGKNPVKRNNYVPILARKGSKEAIDGVDKWKLGFNGKGTPGFTRQRRNPTVKAAQEAGLDVREDIRDIVADRAAKHFQETTHHSIMMDGIYNYGVRLAKGTSKAAEAKNRKLMQQAEKAGIPFKEVTYVVGRRGGPDAEVHKALFPAPIAANLENIDRMFRNPKIANEVLRGFDKIHQGMKFWLTVVNPGHHARNFYGNAFQAYQDGTKNPKFYQDAYKAVRGMYGKTGEPEQLRAAATRIKIGNGTSSLQEISDLYKATGTMSGFIASEYGTTNLSKIGHVVRQFSSGREDTARMAHFIHAIKEKTKKEGADWAKMTAGEKEAFAMDASRRVRKFQFDYGDLTEFEQQFNRRMMMFYTFARKNTVLQLEMLALRPGKIARVPQFNNAVEQLMGVENNASGDPMFDDRVPQWVRDSNAPQVGGVNNFLQRAFGRDDHGDVTDDPIYASPLLPVSDLNRIEKPTDMFRTIISELRPELRMPIEKAFGQRAFSGAPLPDATQTIAQMTPITNLIEKIISTQIDPDKELRNLAPDITSYLSGVSFQRVNPQRQSGELRRRQQIVQEVIREARGDSNDERRRDLRERYEAGNR